MDIATYAAIGSLVLNVFVALVGATWGVARIKSEVKDAVRDEIDAHRTQIDDRITQIEQRVGETTAALRSKINETELWNRDTFMRRDSFYKTMESYSTDMRTQFDKIEKRLERMEEKIDTKS